MTAISAVSRNALPIVVCLILFLAAANPGQARGGEGTNDRDKVAATQPSTAPTARGQKLVIDYGTVADALRASAKKSGAFPDWLARQSEKERDRILADLDTWSLRLEDTVEVKTAAPDGTPVAWRFVDDGKPKIVVAESGKGQPVGKMTSHVAMADLKANPPDQDDEKTSYWSLTWETPEGHHVHVNLLVNWITFSINGVSETSSRPHPARHPPTSPETRPA